VNDGKTDRRTVTVKLKADDGTSLREYTFANATPVDYSLTDVAGCAGCLPEEVLTLEYDSVEFLSKRGYDYYRSQSDMARLSTGDPDGPSNFDSWSGGELRFDLPGEFAGTKLHTGVSGRKSVGEITLRGAMTDGRKSMYNWIKAAFDKPSWRATAGIVELLSHQGDLKPGRAFSLYDGFPVRYVFPKISVDIPLAQTSESITLKFIRVELK